MTQEEVKITHTKNAINEDELSRTATDFGFGANKVWMVIENNVFKKEAGRWIKVEIGDRRVHRITVDDRGYPYVVTLENEIF